MKLATSLVLGVLAMPALCYADENVAGYWHADLGDNVAIEMNVTPDGQWDSQTIKGVETIAEMAGYYTQKVRSDATGTLLFVPRQSKVTVQHGAPKDEFDHYKLSDNGQVLSLTSKGDTMVFKKLTP